MGDVVWPAGLQWGVATSAFQIEGALADDGRAPSVWDTFSAEPGRVADAPGAPGTTAARTACDHYRRWPQDLQLLADLGVTSYRFSTSWSRIEPRPGVVEPRGLDFYDRLVDGLLELGIAPMLTLFHWDLPQWAQDAGGWQSRDTAARLGAYADVVAGRLGDRVALWATTNEMFEHTVLGHLLGEHAPGLRLPLDEVFGVAHHLLLGHGLAAQAVRGRTSSPVLAVNSYAPARPASDSEADVAVAGLYDVLQNRLFTDPLLLGRYPDELQPLVAPFARDEDLDVIATPLDALGVNYYSVNAVRAVEGEVPLEVVPPEGYPRTGFGWAVVPEGLTQVLLRLRDDYGDALPPVYVTENGCAFPDEAADDGSPVLDDADRVAYLRAHVDAVAEAVRQGVDVRGYYVWTLLDNVEWAEGVTQRFGLVHTDFATQQRTPRASFAWYRDHIRQATDRTR
ncbi:MAG TPA: GH1 family beta-glucosidase [Actinomycetales bacterium]|nr:GH1 family beta-glucosidase [Actinomycetales bacterium]